MVESIVRPARNLGGEGGSWRCKTHKRAATHMALRADGTKRHCCDPKLGGILLACDCEKVPIQTADMGTIENLLHGIEGMQGQMQAMTELIVQLEQRISDLERPKPRKLIQVRN